MRAVWTIAFKDFRSIVTSPLFFIIAGLCSIFWSYNFLRALQAFALQSASPMGMRGAGHMNIHYSVFVQHISTVNLVLIFIIPFLTMRLLSEEKKMRTYDLLLTSPVSAAQIAMGKFFGGYMVALTLILVSFLYPVGTSMIADFHWATLFTSFLGMAVVAGVYVAVGLFSSSLTQSAVLSGIMGVLFILFVWFLGQGADMTDNPILTAFLEHVSIGQQFLTFLQGGLNLAAGVFFVSVMVLFVFLTERVVESSRWR